jgi:hypothetical protein
VKNILEKTRRISILRKVDFQSVFLEGEGKEGRKRGERERRKRRKNLQE